MQSQRLVGVDSKQGEDRACHSKDGSVEYLSQTLAQILTLPVSSAVRTQKLRR